MAIRGVHLQFVFLKLKQAKMGKSGEFSINAAFARSARFPAKSLAKVKCLSK
jgi:hypothetical protein